MYCQRESYDGTKMNAVSTCFWGEKSPQKAAADRAAENIRAVKAKLEGNKRQRGKKGRISPQKCSRISYVLPIFPRFLIRAEKWGVLSPQKLYYQEKTTFVQTACLFDPVNHLSSSAHM